MKRDHLRISRKIQGFRKLFTYNNIKTFAVLNYLFPTRP